MTTQPTFTITRETSTGKLEYLTVNGFRTAETHDINDRMYFTREAGAVKVKELRRYCRITSLARTIILNY